MATVLEPDLGENICLLFLKIICPPHLYNELFKAAHIQLKHTIEINKTNYTNPATEER